MKSFKFATVLLGGVILVGCSSEQSPYQYPRKIPEKFQPKIAKTPSKYFMTVKGYVAPEYRKHLKLTWILVYETHNPKCDYTISKFNGVYSSQDKLLFYKVKPDSSGHYEYKLPLQKYEPGFCKWAVSGLYYAFGVLPKHESPLSSVATGVAIFSNKAQEASKKNSYQNFSCANLSCEGFSGLKFISGDHFSSSSAVISPFQNLRLEFNLLKGKQ